MRVQQHILRSNRKTVSQKSYETIPQALRELRRRIGIALIGHPDWSIGTNRDDTAWIEDRNGRMLRVFTLVNKKGAEAIPFGHLLKVNRPTEAKQLVNDAENGVYVQ